MLVVDTLEPSGDTGKLYQADIGARALEGH
jgi:hypothetical protein